jgi:hypothetical protein
VDRVQKYSSRKDRLIQIEREFEFDAKPPRRAIVTVVTASHLHYAIALSQSVRRHEPECDFFVAVVDCSQASKLGALIEQPSIYWLTLQELNLPNAQRMAFHYTPFEMVCACKPFAMRVLQGRGYQQVVYLDADMWLFSAMSHVWNELAVSSVLLTPHLLQPLPNDGKFPTETEYLKCGTFNAGFIAIQCDEVGQSMLEWWSNRMERDCIVDLLGSLFVDQKWLNLVPGLFDRVRVLRHRGYNVGHWSLSQSSIVQNSDGGFAVNGDQLALFHFSKFLPDEPYSFERQQTRVKLRDMPAIAKLMEIYHDALRDAEHASTIAAEDREHLKCGTEIDRAWREAVRRNHPRLNHVIDPFDSISMPGLVDLYRSLEPESTEWRADWKQPRSKRSKWSLKWKKLRRQVQDWWSHR